MTFEEMISDLESAVEDALRYEDLFQSHLARVIADRLGALSVAIEEWRQG